MGPFRGCPCKENPHLGLKSPRRPPFFGNYHMVMFFRWLSHVSLHYCSDENTGPFIKLPSCGNNNFGQLLHIISIARSGGNRTSPLGPDTSDDCGHRSLQEESELKEFFRFLLVQLGFRDSAVRSVAARLSGEQVFEI